MNRDIKKEIGVGIFFLVLAVIYIFGASQISTFTPFGNRGLDSRSVPQLLGVLTIILSVTHIIQSCLKGRRLKKIQAERKITNNETQEHKAQSCIPACQATVINRIDIVVPIKLIISLIYLAAFIALYQPVGFILSSSFFLIVQSLLLTDKSERKKWALYIVLFSIGVSILIYFIFTKYLALNLPSGILG
jgi:putative tricarboxylic transport membrane protein